MRKQNDIQAELIAEYRVILCNGTHPSGRPCSAAWRRMHACGIKGERRVYKWKPANSVQSTWNLLHEIGHLETQKSAMRRCESEFAATQWAADKAAAISLRIPESIRTRYQKYILRERARGVSRGGDLPPAEALQIKW